jgi:beta-lactamase class A
VVLTLILAVPGPAAAARVAPRAPAPRLVEACEAAPLPSPDPELEAIISDVLGPRANHYGVVVADLERDVGAALDPDRVFDAASLFKLNVMHEAFRQRERGALHFDETLPITPAMAAWDLGTLFRWGAVGRRVSVAQLLEQMITLSDNTSANMLATRVGWHRIDDGLRELGLCATRTMTPLQTTAGDIATLLAAMARGQAVSAVASREMEELLLRQQIRDRIPAGIPSDVPVGNKTGNQPDATHDVAIVYAPSGTYVLAVLSDLPWNSTPIVELSRRIYAHQNPE